MKNAAVDRLSRNRLYGDLAWLWPYLSDPADYWHESTFWRRVLTKRLGRGRRSLLDLGVGGGSFLSHLTSRFDAEAVDLSDAMMEHSRRLNPEVVHHVGDMRTVRLGRTFDAVVIHDALNHLENLDDIRATFDTAAAHLDQGGLFVLAPEWYRGDFVPPHVEHTTRSDDELEVTYAEYLWDPDPTDDLLEAVFTYYVKRNGAVTMEFDRLTFGFFEMKTWMKLLRDAGFTVEREPYPIHDDVRGSWLLVGTKK